MKMMDRLTSIGFSVTEFAEFLNISRPTLYKYCEDFDNVKYTKIPVKILDILKTIKVNKLIGKNYIIKMIIDLSCVDFQQKETNIFDSLNNLGYSFSEDEKKFLSQYLNDIDFRVQIRRILNELQKSNNK